MKRALLIISILIASFGCSRPKGFNYKKIVSHHGPAIEWEVEPQISHGEITAILSQPYRYLGSGNHTYAFVSEDGRYVIKFFKQKHMRTRSWVDFLPIPAKRILYPTGKIDRRTQERNDSYSSYKIAYQMLYDETALVYLHLNKTRHLNLSLELFDQHGDVLTVDLDEMEFLVQRKAELAFDYLKTLYKEGRAEEAESAILSLLDVVAKRNLKGIYDRDLQFFKNFGFIKNQAVEVDIGEFRLDTPPDDTYQELKTLSYQIRDFLKVHAPKQRKAVEHKINTYLETYQ